jgi:hypothetical protein
MLSYSWKLASLAILGVAVTFAAETPSVQAKSSTAATNETLNLQVLNFARGKLGTQVGNGECWTLAFQALDHAHAKRPGQDGLTTYQFGKQVALSVIKPGDILQFENVNFKHTSPNGSWSTSSFPHHTAIVLSVNGKQITLLNQNVGGNRTVLESIINLNDREPGGTITAYQPVSR